MSVCAQQQGQKQIDWIGSDLFDAADQVFKIIIVYTPVLAASLRTRLTDCPRGVHKVTGKNSSNMSGTFEVRFHHFWRAKTYHGQAWHHILSVPAKMIWAGVVNKTAVQWYLLYHDAHISPEELHLISLPYKSLYIRGLYWKTGFYEHCWSNILCFLSHDESAGPPRCCLIPGYNPNPPAGCSPAGRTLSGHVGRRKPWLCFSFCKDKTPEWHQCYWYKPGESLEYHHWNKIPSVNYTTEFLFLLFDNSCNYKSGEKPLNKSFMKELSGANHSLAMVLLPVSQLLCLQVANNIKLPEDTN